MLSKIAVLLFVAHAISGIRLGGPQEQLKIAITKLNEYMHAELHEASISIRAFAIPLGFYTDNARVNVDNGLIEDAKPFWTKIAALEEQAKEVGKSYCIDQGVELFYDLNITVEAVPYITINHYLNKGNATLFESSDKINAVEHDLEDLTTRANACAQDECASDLLTETISFHATGPQTVKAAVDEIDQYVQVDLLKYLATALVDTVSYVRLYNTILGLVEICIN